jgi:hypothetical protein
VIGVLGVLVVSGEYGTGMIRATFSAVPTRTPVLWAKLVIFAVVSFVVGTASSFAAFLGGQAFLSPQHIETTLSAPGVFRAVFGVGLYLTVVGMLGVALGWLIRHWPTTSAWSGPPDSAAPRMRGRKGDLHRPARNVPGKRRTH